MGVPSPGTASEVCAIVVSYNPDSGFDERLRLMLAQFPEVFVIDNGSLTSVDSLACDQEVANRIHFIRNPENYGIAKALNIGVLVAIKSGYSWAVTFDQDSIISDSLLESLVQISKRLGKYETLVGANYRDFYRKNNGDEALASSIRTEAIEKTTLITSGMLVPLRFVERIGGFREDYFIDSVDHEFCLRASRHGATLVRTKNPLMIHSIGERGGRIHFSRMLSSHHSPGRKYFISRNALLTVREYGSSHPIWALRQILRVFAEMVGTLSFERDKGEKMRALLRGIKDAFLRAKA